MAEAPPLTVRRKVPLGTAGAGEGDEWRGSWVGAGDGEGAGAGAGAVGVKVTVTVQLVPGARVVTAQGTVMA